MSVYDCEPPQLDCDIPPADEEIGKRREHEIDFDLDDIELSTYSMNLNTEHAISNAVHLYSSSPPPVDDFFIRSNDCLDNLEIPQDEVSENTEKSTNDEDSNHIDIPELDFPSLEKKNEHGEISLEENKSEAIDLKKANNDITDEIPEFPQDVLNVEHREEVCNFVLEDILDNEDTEFSSQYLSHQQESPKIELVEEVQSLENNNDFDTFTDFEQAIPIDRKVEQQQIQHEPLEEISEPKDIHFETDFSPFEANFDIEFQNFNEESKETLNKIEEKEPNDNIDDDDFGDFNDFKQAPTQTETTMYLPKEIHSIQTDITVLNDSEVKTILGEMFPIDQQVNDDVTFNSMVCIESEVKIVKDFDSTLALTYDYKDSTTNHILIKALGIDERNILFGAQWSSNMPRFASDLSFNPLEPSKFASASYNKNSNSVVNNSSIKISCKTKEKDEIDTDKEHNQQLPQPDIVPQFDWNVAGLINPLDGKQTNTLKTTNEEPSLTYDLNVFDNTPQKTTEVKSSELENSSLSSKHLWQNERFDVTNTVVRERTIKLPETHIFTPIKSISPVAREVSRETSPIENEKDKRTTVIKEYHDIEYSLEPSKKTDSDGEFGDFNEFQSATTSNNIITPSIFKPGTALSALETTILEPQKMNETKVSSNAEIHDFESIIANQININQTTHLKYDLLDDFSKIPEDSNEDDFADFQAAPTIIPQKKSPVEKKFYKEDSSITLSPSRLVSNMQKIPEPKSQQVFTTWMNDTLDSDEISRIEAAFPKCKVDSNKKKQHDINPVQREDDEWCDFQSVSQSSNIISSHTVPNQLSSFTNSPLDAKKTNSDNITSDSSDWSDFVSVPIVKPPLNTSQFLSKPNFSSWNQSAGKPYVNHTTSFLSSNNSYGNNHFDESFYSSMSDTKKHKQPMTITNNYNYSFERNDVSSTVPPYQMSNGISTILPDLQFALPKTLVNLSRGNASDTTKK